MSTDDDKFEKELKELHADHDRWDANTMRAQRGPNHATEEVLRLTQARLKEEREEEEWRLRAKYGKLTPSHERAIREQMERDLRKSRQEWEEHAASYGKSVSHYQDELEEDQRDIQARYTMPKPKPIVQPPQPSYTPSVPSPPTPSEFDVDRFFEEKEREAEQNFLAAIQPLQQSGWEVQKNADGSVTFTRPAGDDEDNDEDEDEWDEDDEDDEDEEDEEWDEENEREEAISQKPAAALPPGKYGSLECLCGTVNLLSSIDRNVYCSGCGRLLFDISKNRQSTSTSAPPTHQEPDRHQPEGGKWRLGRDMQTGRYLDAPQASRRQGLYIIGIQGTGKSVLIENLIIQDIKQNNIGVCVLDPHGDLINAVLERLPDRREKDVIFLDITDYRYPFGINLFNCSDPSNPFEVQKIVDQVIHVFEKLLGVSHDTPLILNYLKNCTRTLITNPGYTMADIPLLLQDGECRKKLVANVTDIDVQRFWRLHDQKKPADQNIDIASTLRRVDEFLQPLSRNIVGQGTSTIDLRQVMDEAKILLVKLDTTVESITELIGSLFIALFLNAAKSRADLPANKRRQFNLYADEFQRFATEDFATLLEEARKYGFATTIAHQNRGQLDSRNSQLETNLKDRTRSAANLVVFRVNSKDAGDLAGEFDITPQAAWEEELEEEWVEIIKPQEHQRIEEQVEVEIEEDIEEISQNPVDYLTGARGTHTSIRVREGVPVILHLLEKVWYGKTIIEYVKNFLNALLVDVMEGRVKPETDNFAERLEVIVRNSFLGWDLFPSLEITDFSSVVTTYEFEEKKVALHRTLERYQSDFIRELILGDHSTAQAQYRDSIIETRKALYEAKIAVQVYRAGEIYKLDLGKEHRYNLIAYQDELNERKREYQRNYETKIRAEKTVDIRELVDEELEKITNFVTSFHLLSLDLATNPIKVPTGQKRLVKRLQPHLTYLTHESEKITHPRVAITHPQRTYADVLNEVASQISNLPVYTAKVKVTSDNGIEEHMIRTLDPKQDENGRSLFGQALQERIARIQAQNRTPDERGISCCRPRQVVEAEIRTRQGQCSEPPEAEPPISRHPQH